MEKLCAKDISRNDTQNWISKSVFREVEVDLQIVQSMEQYYCT